ncbi:DUF1883 domain-containing protein [Actinospica robiniae]|uniref:DUF1883 domain-containing protein n=1 Tax=Actinospica robiniae TaxID=304901 RepID=UPI00068532A1|nr:DUF1883 domain-containing protein [Actinospica robiniae]
MSFLNYDLGSLAAGEIVTVTLEGVASNVMLMRPAEVQNFVARRRFRYHGGYVRKSPVSLQAPSAGQWHLIVQPKGGDVRASVRVRHRVL